MHYHDKPTLADAHLTSDALSQQRMAELNAAFPVQHFDQLLAQDFPFYRTTFWLPLDRKPANVFETVISDLCRHVQLSARVIGVEWWFSVLRTNATPQWLLPCHFDRDDLNEPDPEKFNYPEWSSVLYLNQVSYGELVVTDQIMTARGIRPRQPDAMRFIAPEPNLYSVFPGHLYHGVMGRMWREKTEDALRIAMAVNYWTTRPKVDYMDDSHRCLEVFGLTSSSQSACGHSHDLNLKADLDLPTRSRAIRNSSQDGVKVIPQQGRA